MAKFIPLPIFVASERCDSSGMPNRAALVEPAKSPVKAVRKLAGKDLMKTHDNPVVRSTFVELPTTPDGRHQDIEKSDGSGQGSASALAKMKLLDRKNAQLKFGVNEDSIFMGALHAQKSAVQ